MGGDLDLDDVEPGWNSGAAFATIELARTDAGPCGCEKDRKEPCEDTKRPASVDPNDIVGPSGFGPEHWISADQTFHYTIHFENDPLRATAPAQLVRVTQQLSTNLDPRTFRLGVMGFGTNLIEMPADRTFYQTRLNLMNTHGVLLDVTASLDLAKNEVSWEFSSLDPVTGDLPFDPFVGFLPPDTDGIIGQGFVTYTIKPKSGIAQGDIINSQARIFFDYNEPMDTTNIFNTVDTGLPTSTVLPLPLTSNRNVFPVHWLGTDAYGGAGVADFTIYVSDNNGPWRVWLANTPQTESTFVGQCGHTYAFYSDARDHVGNVENAVTAPQAFIQLLSNSSPILQPIADRVLAVGQALSITNFATDTNGGPQITFSLAPGAPSGMSINATNGVLSWTPSCDEGGRSNFITVIATEEGCQVLTSAQSFTVMVTECLQIGLGATVSVAGGSGCVAVSLESSFNLTNLSFTLHIPAGRFTNFTVNATAPEVGSTTLMQVNNTEAIVTLAALPGQVLRGAKQFAEVCFGLVPDQVSAFVRLEAVDVLGLRENGSPLGNTFGSSGRAVVVGEHPLLECVSGGNAKPTLLLYARPGWICAIEERADFQPSNQWQEFNRLSTTNLVTMPTLAGTNIQSFYRAVRFAPVQPRSSFR